MGLKKYQGKGRPVIGKGKPLMNLGQPFKLGGQYGVTGATGPDQPLSQKDPSDLGKSMAKSYLEKNKPTQEEKDSIQTRFSKQSKQFDMGSVVTGGENDMYKNSFLVEEFEKQPLKNKENRAEVKAAKEGKKGKERRQAAREVRKKQRKEGKRGIKKTVKQVKNVVEKVKNSKIYKVAKGVSETVSNVKKGKLAAAVKSGKQTIADAKAKKADQPTALKKIKPKEKQKKRLPK